MQTKVFIILMLLAIPCLGDTENLNSFNAGELSPYLEGRADIEKYYSGCRYLENYLPYTYGAIQKRPGTKFIASNLLSTSTEVSPDMLPIRVATTLTRDITMQYMNDLTRVYGLPYTDATHILTLDAGHSARQVSTGVKLPCYLHPFKAGQTITISGTVNYNGDWTVQAATTTNEIVINHSGFHAETFTGTEQVIMYRAIGGQGRMAMGDGNNLYIGTLSANELAVTKVSSDFLTVDYNSLHSPGGWETKWTSALSLGDGNSCTLETTVDCAAGDMSFNYTVFSYNDPAYSSGNDYLDFYIDGELKLSETGFGGNNLVSYSVSAGSHTFKWVYRSYSWGYHGGVAMVHNVNIPVPTTFDHLNYEYSTTVVGQNWSNNTTPVVVGVAITDSKQYIYVMREQGNTGIIKLFKFRLSDGYQMWALELPNGGGYDIAVDSADNVYIPNASTATGSTCLYFGSTKNVSRVLANGTYEDFGGVVPNSWAGGFDIYVDSGMDLIVGGGKVYQLSTCSADWNGKNLWTRSLNNSEGRMAQIGTQLPSSPSAYTDEIGGHGSKVTHNGFIYVVDQTNGTVYKLNTDLDVMATTVPVGDGPLDANQSYVRQIFVNAFGGLTVVRAASSAFLVNYVRDPLWYYDDDLNYLGRSLPLDIMTQYRGDLCFKTPIDTNSTTYTYTVNLDDPCSYCWDSEISGYYTSLYCTPYAASRLVPFEFSTDDTYVLAITGERMFFFRDGDVGTDDIDTSNTDYPSKATLPNPADGATSVSITQDVNWTTGLYAGLYALSHEVYFGTSFDDVNAATTSSPEFKGNRTDTTYNPGTLAYITTYYWRVDERNCYGTTKGDVWSFTTIADSIPFFDGFESGGFLTEGWTKSDANASVTYGTDALNGGPVYVAAYTGDYGACLTRTAWIQKILSTVGYVNIHAQYRRESHISGYVEWSVDGVNWTNIETTSNNSVHYTDGLMDKQLVGAGNGTLYLRFRTDSTYELPFYYTLDIDDVNVFVGGVASKATTPSPIDGATDVSVIDPLSWTAGTEAAVHDLYFGTSNPPDFVDTLESASYDPTLDFNTTYYWRIDEKNDSVATADVTTGDVWSFTTGAEVGDPPTYIGTAGASSGTTGISPLLPSDSAENDILIFAIETSNEAITIDNENGGTWTEVANSPQSVGGTRLTVFWSRYNGTQGRPTTSDSGNHQLGRIICIRGAITTGTPFDITAGGTDAVSNKSGSIPGETTTVANTLIVTIIATDLPDATGSSNFSSWQNVDLLDVTERTNNTTGVGNGGGLSMATGIKTAAGAYGNTSVTLANSAVKAMMSIAIKAP